jgi:hypothetical protein
MLTVVPLYSTRMYQLNMTSAWVCSRFGASTANMSVGITTYITCAALFQLDTTFVVVRKPVPNAIVVVTCRHNHVTSTGIMRHRQPSHEE